VSAFVRLYPTAWRARYGPEFEALLVERPPAARDRIDIVLGAVDARLSPQVDPSPIVTGARIVRGNAIAPGAQPPVRRTATARGAA